MGQEGGVKGGLSRPVGIKGLAFGGEVVFPPLAANCRRESKSVKTEDLGFCRELTGNKTTCIIVKSMTPMEATSPAPGLCSSDRVPMCGGLTSALRGCSYGLTLRLFRPRCSIPNIKHVVVRTNVTERTTTGTRTRKGTRRTGERVRRYSELAGNTCTGLRRSVRRFIARTAIRRLRSVGGDVTTYTMGTRGTKVSTVRMRKSHLLNSLYSGVLGRERSRCKKGLRGHAECTLRMMTTVGRTTPSLVVRCGLPVVAMGPSKALHKGNKLRTRRKVRFTGVLSRTKVSVVRITRTGRAKGVKSAVPPVKSITCG